MGLLTFCAAARAVLVKGGSYLDDSLSSATAEAVSILKQAYHPEAPVNLFSKDGFADAVSRFIDDSNARQFWSHLKPEDDLFTPLLFEQCAQMAIASGGYYSKILNRTFIQRGKIENKYKPTDLIPLIATTKVFFRGAGFYAYERGAFDVAERLLWWGVVACEAQGLPVEEQVIDRLVQIYEEIGRVKMGAQLRGLQEMHKAPERHSLWHAELSLISEEASHLYARFQKLEGSLEGRRHDFTALEQKFLGLVEKMVHDPMVAPLVADDCALLTANRNKNDTIIVEVRAPSSLRDYGYWYSRKHARYLPENQALLYQQTLNWIRRHTQEVGGAQSRSVIFPTLDPLYLNCAVVIFILREYVQYASGSQSSHALQYPRLLEIACENALDGFSRNRDVSALISMAAQLEMARSLFGNNDAIQLRIYAERIWSAIDSSVRTQISRNDYGAASVYEFESDFPLTELSNDFDREMLILMDGNWGQVLDSISTWDESKKRLFAQKIIQNREKIRSSWRDKMMGLDGLIDFLDSFEQQLPNFLDIPLWACELEQSSANPVKAYERLMEINKRGSNLIGLKLWLNILALFNTYSSPL